LQEEIEGLKKLAKFSQQARNDLEDRKAALTDEEKIKKRFENALPATMGWAEYMAPQIKEHKENGEYLKCAGKATVYLVGSAVTQVGDVVSLPFRALISHIWGS